MRAAKALEEKARESLPTSSYTTNPMPSRSPERSLVKGNQHKRMQSLQPSSVRDLRSYLDTHKSPERSPERPKTRDGSHSRDAEKDYFSKEDSRFGQFGTPSPSSNYDLSHTPTSRHRAFLGENTPPSATMKALQTMTIPPHILDPPLQNITNSSTPTPAPGQPLDSISTQLLSITNIVSSLQKDMSQLSRRSKDNATDLISLKEATNSRDEDIRQSLKDLLSTMTDKQKVAAAAAAAVEEQRSAPLNLHDPHMTPTKQFTFPRMSSPSGWADERMGSPNPYSVEGAASVAMLEKIIREMVTKDGQERLIANLQVIVDKANGDTAKKVSELVEFVKQGSANNLAPPGSASFQPSPGSGALTRTLSEGYSQNFGSSKASDFVSEEMLKYLRKIKDTAAESGCVTMATKSLVQELRGEVLGMGRELARKIEEAEQAKATEPHADPEQTTEEINAIIQDGLADLKEHMDKVMRERRRQSMSSVVTRGTVDNNEVYDVVKHALAERGLDQYSAQGAPIDKEAIVTAIREAYDSVEMKPNVEIQQFGLERDEILQCLREGLQDYNGSGAVSREEIGDIVQESLQQLRLPPPVNEANEIREEILMAVRDSLEELKPSLVPQQSQADALTREVLLDAIKEALSTHEFGPQEVEIPQEALFDAVKAGLEASQPDVDANNEVVVQRIQALVDSMHSEFKAYSAANGRDTEQVLDALRDGLDRLGADLQGHFDKAPDASQQDAIVDTFRVELDKLREDVQGYVAEGPRGDQEWSRGDMVTFIKTELENLHEGLSAKLASNDKEELLAALKAGFDEMNSQVALRSEDADSNEDINEALKHEFDQLKEVILGDTAGHKNDIMEKLEAGFDGLQVGLREATASSAPNDDVLTAMKTEFEHLRETIGGSLMKSGGADKDDIVDAVRELLDGLRAAHDTTSKESVTVLQADLEALRESLGGALVPASDNDKAEILETIKTTLDEIKTSSTSAGVNEELLEAFRGELEQIRQSDGLTRQHGRADTEEVLEAVRLGLDDLRSHLEKKLDGPRDGSSSGEIVDALNEGLEGLRVDVTKLSSKPIDMTVSYEILDTLREGIAALREDVALLKGKAPSAAPPPEVEVEVEVDTVPTGNEMVLAEAPGDGPAEDREIIDEPAAAAPAEEVEETTSREIVSDSTQRNDVDKMEFILSQIHAKVEAMDANAKAPAPAAEAAVTPGAAMKDDLASIEGMLKEVQAAVLVLQERDTPPPVMDGLAKKEDTDAIETLVANTKAKIEELVFPDPATAVTKENLEDVELVVRTTSEALDALAKKIEEEGATKADVTVVQVIADDIKTALDEMKAAKPEDPTATKADVDGVTLLVDDLKAKLDDMKIPDPDEIPSKADIEQLTGLIHEFRDSHEKMKDTYEEDILKTANNFDDRRKEAESLVENISEVKTALDTMKEEILVNFNEGGSIEGLKTSLATMQETIGANNITADVKELMETLTREFERAHGSIEGLQNDHAEKSALHLEKHDEIKGAIVADFTEKLEEKFNVLMAKYDDAQLLADEQARVMKEKAEEQEKILETTKTMADELRLTIDTLGATIAGMNERFEEHQTKMASDSTTAFEKLDGSLEKIDGAVAKFEEQKLEEKSEHSHTRDELKNIENIFTGLQDEITEHNPKFMMALREIEALVKAHYDHAQKSKEEAEEHTRAMNEEAKARSVEIQEHFANLPKMLPAPVPEPEKYDDAHVQEKLDKLLAIEPSATYDDAAVQEKLDKLLGHADDATKAAGQLERLEEIQAQVKATAVEVSDFVAKQTQLTLEGNESKEREAEELALLVERRSAQKEQLEADLENLKLEKSTYKEQLYAELDDLKAEKEHVLQELKEEKARVMAELKEEKDRTMQELKEEKDSLLAIVASLQAERENLANQKVRLTGEVSSLHTALDIRREELHMMDAKADALERRILNGIMDHSRALMIAKGSKSPSKMKKRMSVDGGAERSLPPTATANAVNMALKARPAIRRSAPNSTADRRIFSLGQISGNAPPAAKTHLAPTTANTGSGLKRAHSVKTNPRKSSWNGRPSAVVANKENAPLIEEAEPDAETQAPASVAPSTIAEDVQSETGTERRYSVASESNYDEGETPGDARSNYGSEYTYGSGSYMTGSDIDRRTSYGSQATRSIAPAESAVDGASESESESDEEEDDEQTTKLDASEISGVTGSEVSDVTASEVSEMPMPTESAIDRAVAAVAQEMKVDPKSFAPTDSGLGTEIPTADMREGTLVDADYFRRAAEEESVMGSTVG